MMRGPVLRQRKTAIDDEIIRERTFVSASGAVSYYRPASAAQQRGQMRSAQGGIKRHAAHFVLLTAIPAGGGLLGWVLLGAASPSPQ